MKRHVMILAALLLPCTTAWAALPTPASTANPATSAGQDELVVTGMRRDLDGYDERQPSVGLKRLADYAVQEVTVAGDTRDPARRHAEIFDMIRGALVLATSQGGVELATGDKVVEPLRLENYRSLTLASDGRPDAERTSFLVKVRLTPGVDAKTAIERIDRFVKAVPPVGRAEMKPSDDLTLTVVGPDQYRSQIIEAVAADARATAARFGPDYGVEIKGLDRPVEWSRASLTEVFLYLPITTTVVPKGR